MKIWVRYLLKEVFKIFALILCCFFFLYSMMDYSLHVRSFVNIPFYKALLYYLGLFSKRLDLLVPLSLLLAAIRSLSSLSRTNEILALQASGISYHRLTAPLFAVGGILTLFLYAGHQFLVPISNVYTDRFEATYFKKKDKRVLPIYGILLESGGHLIYQAKVEGVYTDVFYIPDFDHIYHMNRLEGKVGTNVDYIARSPLGQLEKKASYPTHTFKELKINPKKTAFIPYENRSLSALFQDKEATNELKGKLAYKLTAPLFCLLCLLGVLPYAISYSRGRSSFFLYAFSLFGFIFYYVLVSLATTLTMAGALSPWISFPILIAVPLITCGSKYLFRVS